jgi:predicted permease
MRVTWIADLRYALRRLGAQPAYALLAVLTLALGVGGTAAIFGIARVVLIDPLPYAHADEVGVFWKKSDWTEEEFFFVRGRVPGFQQVALYRQGDLILSDGDASARLVPGAATSSELFDVLGTAPLLGRGFRRGDDVPGAEAVTVLSFGLWQELGGGASVIGMRLTLDGTPRTVVGVMPRGFWFPDPSVRVWTPVPLTPEGRSYNSTLIGRVASGYAVGAMEAPVAQLTAMLDERFDYAPQWDKTRDARIAPLRDDLAGGVRPALLAALGAMVLILLIACANVAALMLGQVDGRFVELAVRSAVGATRGRLVQPLAIEALVIAAAAGALGAVLAWGGSALMTRALPLGAWTETAAPDWRLFVTAMAIAAAAGVLAMLAPALSLVRSDLSTVLSRARTSGIGGRGGRLENGLVIAEVALAVMVAAGTALLARSVVNLYAIDPGVRIEGVAVVDVVLPGRLGRAHLQQMLDDMTTALVELPGVHSAGAAQKLPLRAGGYNMPLRLAGRPDLVGVTTEYRIVTPGYLETVGIALRRGRTIAATDRPEAERVVVVNDALAERFFAGADPVGQLVDDGSGRGPSRIVGVVDTAVERGLTDSAPPVQYVAAAQLPWLDQPQSLVLRAALGVDEATLLEPVRRAVARVAPGVAVQQTTTMRRVHDTAIGPARQVVLLISLLAALALALGAVGIYGVIAHAAARRRRDWAIRLALGLPASRVVARVVGHGLALVAIGIAVGAPVAAGLTRLLSSLLNGVSVVDPLAFAAAAAALLGIGALAALLPAWRAGMSNPSSTLREP